RPLEDRQQGDHRGAVRRDARHSRRREVVRLSGPAGPPDETPDPGRSTTAGADPACGRTGEKARRDCLKFQETLSTPPVDTITIARLLSLSPRGTSGEREIFPAHLW